MKTQLIRTFIFASALCASNAQPSAGISASAPSAAPAPENRPGAATAGVAPTTSSRSSRPSSSATMSSGGSGYGGVGSGISAPTAASSTYGTRLNQIVPRTTTSGSAVILTSPVSQKEADEMAEDLGVLNFIFSKNLERTFDDKGPDYRLGVPMTLSRNLVETLYLQPSGVLVKVQVPFPVATEGKSKTKTDPAPAANSDWEKARRALLGNPEGDYAPTTSASYSPALSYDEKLVGALKKQMIDALKNASNLRHIPADQTITVAIFGDAESGVTADAGIVTAEASRPTVLTIQIKLADAVAVAKGTKTIEELTKEASITSYFTTTPLPTQANTFGRMAR